MFLNKTEVLNGALENIPSSYAYDLWNRMGNNCDGYSLNFMLQKAKNFEQAKGIFNTFMERLEQQEEENKTKLKVGEIYLNDLLIRPPLIAGLRNARNCSINTIYWKQTSLYWITRASTHKVSYTNA